MRTLVTGANGFTGRYVVAELARAGHAVHATGSQAAFGHPDLPVASYACADLLDQEALADVVRRARPDWVVHLAAIAFVAEADAERFYATNLLGTRNLLQALSVEGESRPHRVLLASSANVYGAATRVPIDEATPPSPANDYGVSKIAMEFLARTYADRLPIVVARPFNYTGVGQSERFLVPKLVARYRNREAVVRLGNLDVARDFSDVRDVAFAYRRLLEEETAGRVFNVCSGRASSLAELLAALERLSGHRLAVETDPALVRDREIKLLVGDKGALATTIGGWAPRPLEDTLAWMLAEGAAAHVSGRD